MKHLLACGVAVVVWVSGHSAFAGDTSQANQAAGEAVRSITGFGERFADPRESVTGRVAAAASIVKQAKDNPDAAARQLVQCLGDAELAIALCAGNSLGQIGAPAAPLLREALADKSPRMRRFAAFALAKMGPAAKDALPALVAALKDKEDLVRRNAAEALGRIGDAAAVEPLQKLSSDRSTAVKVAAAGALRALKADTAAFARTLGAANVTRPDPDDTQAFKADEYLIGGPMAGVKLPPAPTQFGEPAGFPGAIPDLNKKWAAEHPDLAGDAEPLNDDFTPVGQAPEVELYPGSVERWRGEMMKYLPQRSFFDKQSQLKNWVAPKIPGATAAQAAEYAEPISWMPRWAGPAPTGYKKAPVAVMRWGAESKPITLDCGRLPIGVYCVRVIAAVETGRLQFFRKPLLLRMKVNDGLNGERNEYVKRENYTDEFFSLGEFYFHAPAERRYEVELSVDKESGVALLVHNVALDNVLSGIARRPVKTDITLNAHLKAKLHELMANPVNKRFPGMLAEERERRDAWLWESMPRINSQANRPYNLPKTVAQGTDKLDSEKIQQEFGAWNHGVFWGTFHPTPADTSVWLSNPKLGLVYTRDDRDRQRPLPAPYPFSDFGCGLVYPAADGSSGAYWTPIGNVVTRFYWDYPGAIHGSVQEWVKSGDESYARDAAVALARWAYHLPTLDASASLVHNNVAAVGMLGDASRFHRRATTSNFYRWYTEYASEIMDDYDLLYDYLMDNWEVAASVHRYVPWVSTPRDVVKLIDVYLLQMTTKKMLRYHWFTGEMNLARLATMVGNPKVTDPWMEFLFTRTFVYPFPVSGLPDLMITGCTREGTEYVASTMYGGGENAIPKAADLQIYLKRNGNPKYDMSDPVLYPKPASACYWLIERHVAGLNHIRIGDVCGPDKYYGVVFSGLDTASLWGWRWTRDPVFAFIRKHYFDKADFTDAEWADIEKAAGQVRRAPWLDLPSRALPQWATILESGRQHDDYRFRRAVMLRAGMGWGHHHNDGLDLEVYMHGAMMTCDAGQRPGYSKPADRSTRMHNLVEVDGLADHGGEWLGHNWTRALSDADGAKYARMEAVPPKEHPGVTLYQRQVALLDVDEGKGSQPLAPEQCKPGSALPTNVVTADSYVFDVFRVSGGKRHTYCFHGNRSDAVTHNLTNPVEIAKASDKDKAYVNRMAGERLAGDAPEHLEMTWRITQSQVNADLRPNQTLTPHFTRLHVLAEKGARVLRGSLDCTQWGYQIPMAFIQRRSADEDNTNAVGNLESAFAAVIEPYAGEPFIADIVRLPVDANEADARQAVALNVKLKNGRDDLCFADGRPEAVRKLAAVSVAGEFAYLSRDKDGLRQASLTGGTLLQAPGLTLRAARREYAGKVTRVDFPKRTMWLDQAWPLLDASKGGVVFEVGQGDHWTAYTAKALRAEGGGTAVVLRDGADYYLSRVKEIDRAANIVTCALGFGSGAEGRPTPGIDKHWYATNEDGSKFWRAEFLGGNIGLARYGFKLDGPPATMEDFGRTRAFRLWEYGVGDSVRHSTFVSVQRVGPGEYAVSGDVDVEVTLGGKTVAVTVAEIARSGGAFRIALPAGPAQATGVSPEWR